MRRITSILAAISIQDRRDFLPQPLLGELQGLTDRFEEIDRENLTPAQFNQKLLATNPEVLITGWKTPPLPAALPPNLRYVCHLVGSIKSLVSRAHLERGLLVSNWGSSISRVVAEWALFQILSCLRRGAFWTLAMHRDGAWKNEETETASLFERRVGLHGFGHVARELVRLLQPFNCAISAYAPDLDEAKQAQYGVAAAPTLESLFADNDVIVELAPLIPGTARIVTEKLLRLIRPGGVFVNVGRGAVVDEEALLRVARDGKINVGLDVFTVEPLPADSGFRGLPNVTLSPHLAGPTTDRRRDAGAFALSNLRAYAAARPLEAQITADNYDLLT